MKSTIQSRSRLRKYLASVGITVENALSAEIFSCGCAIHRRPIHVIICSKHISQGIRA